MSEYDFGPALVELGFENLLQNSTTSRDKGDQVGTFLTFPPLSCCLGTSNSFKTVLYKIEVYSWLCYAFSLLLYLSGMALVIAPLVFASVTFVTLGNDF